MLVPPLRRDERRWLLGILVLTACSWGRWLATGSPKVDENYPSELAGCLLMVGVVVGWGLVIVGWRGLLLRPVANPRRLAFTGLALATAMLPLLSNDFFSLMTYGSLAARGRDVYTTAASLPESVWYSWVGQRWNDKVCVYGPTTLVALLPAGLAGSSPWLGLLLFRLLWLPPLVLVMELSFRAMRDRPFFHAMVWLNPLWILEGPGQLHADLLGVVGLVAGILLQQRGRPLAGWACWALATLGKYSFAFTAFWFWLSGARTTRERLLRPPAMGLVLLALGAVFFAPFWHGLPTLTEPIHTLGTMVPGGSIAEVMGHVVHVLRGGAMPSPETPVRIAVEMDRANKATTWFVVSLVMRLVALFIGVRIVRAMLREPRDEGRIAMGTGALVVAVITLVSHRFQSWYLLAALPFFGLHCTAVWRRWWIAIVAVSVAPDFTHMLPKSAVLLPIWSATTTAAGVILFLVWFRGRYLTLDQPAQPDQSVDRAVAPQRAIELAEPAPPPAGN
jgi:hypothetical protein